MEDSVILAKKSLDNIIRKSRVHLYKPIQIAEILYHKRLNPHMDLMNLESYRSESKKWRDDITIHLLGTRCTSSAKFQDDIFSKTAMPPETLAVLGEENNRTGGAVEAYIYNSFRRKYVQLEKSLNYVITSTTETFDVKAFIDLFWNEPGLKRSIDKIYEIIVYSLFSSLADALELMVSVSINPDKRQLLLEFEDFTQNVMSIDVSNPIMYQHARLYRVGVTNAADRGLDIYSNWGPAIQVKHLALDEELAEDIVTGISSDRIVIVCKSAEQRLIVSLLNQIGWKSKIQSIITEQDLIRWYDKALRGKFSKELGLKLMHILQTEIEGEFPSLNRGFDVLADRNYDDIKNMDWLVL